MPELIVLCGLPGAGKSTYANRYVQEHPNTKIMSSDAIRKELYGDEMIQGDAGRVFRLMRTRTVEHLMNGFDVIYDATGMMRRYRAEIVDVVPAGIQKKCVIVWADVEECVKRDSLRSRKVGRAVIEQMVSSFQAPYYDEGFDEIQIILPDDFDRAKYDASHRRRMKPKRKIQFEQNRLSWMSYGLKDGSVETAWRIGGSS